jgi:glycosyltransferase involved in cell wall biosynthesis
MPRVLFLAGCLAQGGAEKQMVYMVESLLRLGAGVQVLTLARGGFYEARLQAMGVNPQWVGGVRHPVLRLAAMARVAAAHRPHFIQAGHTYMNAYALGLGRFCRAISIGAVRTNLTFLDELHSAFVIRILMLTTALITNSERTRTALIEKRLARAERIHYVPNAIEIDATSDNGERKRGKHVRALFLGRLIAGKRVDRFLRAVELARRHIPELTAVIAGSGPEKEQAQRQARQLGLGPSDTVFLGHCVDTRQVIRSADFLVFSSDDIEGSPNAILESMADGLPVVTTRCGNAAALVRDGHNGYVCEFNDAALAEKMVWLAKDIGLRERMGEASRRRAGDLFGTGELGLKLLEVYRAAALSRRDTRALGVVEGACQLA